MDGIRKYFRPVVLEYVQEQHILVEGSPGRRLDGDTDLDNLRLVRTEYSVGGIKNRRFQNRRLWFRLLLGTQRMRQVLGE